MNKQKALASRLRRLAQAIAAAPKASPSANLSCTECEALLEFYVDTERRSDPSDSLQARARFPAVWGHLETCARCQESYRLLSESWKADSTPPLDDAALAAPPLPFLVPASNDAAWSKRVRSRVGGAPLGFSFIIRVLHLQRVVSVKQPTLAVRGVSKPSKKALALSDTIPLGNLNVNVEMWAQRLENSDNLRLEILLASSAPLPEPLRATLRWNDHTYSDLVRQGRFSFDGIPVSILEGARELRVEFECAN